MESPCRCFTFQRLRSSQPDSTRFILGTRNTYMSRQGILSRRPLAIRYMDKRIRWYVLYYDNLVLFSMRALADANNPPITKTGIFTFAEIVLRFLRTAFLRLVSITLGVGLISITYLTLRSSWNVPARPRLLQKRTNQTIARHPTGWITSYFHYHFYHHSVHVL